MSPAPQTVDTYLASVSEDARAALEELRRQMKAAAPDADERISYQIPTFIHHAPLVAFSAAKNHCSLHLLSPAVRTAHKDELKPYDTTTATIRFTPASRSPMSS